MTETDTPKPTGSDAEPTEAPNYKSPTEQLLESVPFIGGFITLAGKATSGGGGSGEFVFDPEEMEALWKEFDDEVTELTNMLRESRRTSQQVKPLAEDPASTAHYRAVKAHDETLHTAIEQQLKFAEKFRDAIGEVIGRKTEEDISARDAMDKLRGRTET